jgi:LacI family transcriptional regulator
MKNINIKHLAAKLNLSVSTVSKALHDSYEISEDTKKRVTETAATLNYIPNPYASGLRGRKSKNIAVVIPEVTDSFFSLAINGIESVAKEKGYHVLIYLTHENFENEKNILKEFQCGRVDGVLISVSSETSQVEHINNLISNGVPVIFFDRICEKVETAMITTDDFESSYKAVKHLIQQGCDRIAFLGISKKLSISGKRLAGYFQALADHKFTANKKDVLLCTHDEHQNYLLISGLLKKKNKPNGIVASVEKLTTPVYQACLFLKLNIPEDVKLVCFSNLTTASILNPSLTTITQPAFEMGKESAIVLFKALEKRNFNLKNESKIIPSTLIVRSSTGPF